MKIECTGIDHSYGNLKVLQDFNLSVPEGKFYVILGPSGCGKSTILRFMAGFEQPTQGAVYIDGQKVVGPSRKIGFVFQDYALFPWKTVLGNVMAGIRDKKQKKGLAMRYLRKVGLEKFAHVYPHNLSGGMKQRVGIARALVYNPEILLMDEPFGALDAQTKKVMQQELLDLLKKMKKTIVFITHSVLEAVYLGDEVIVMSKSPSKIVYKKKIDLEYAERNYTNHHYLKYREEILKHLHPEVGIH